MKASELRKKAVSELQNEMHALLRELFNLRIQRGVGQSPQTHLFKKVRRDIARIKTTLREKEEGSSL